MTDYTVADNLRTDLKMMADDRGEITADRPTLTVTYTTPQGNQRTRTGDVWRVSDGRAFDDAVIRFSANAGETDEDAYFIRVRHGDMTLVSVSERGTETALGAVVSVAVDGLPAEKERAVADGGDTIRTTVVDAALAGVTDDPDVTAAVADVEPDATLAACRSNDPLLDFDEYMEVHA